MYQTLKEKQTIITHFLKGNKQFSNNPLLPLLIYPRFFDIEDEDGRILIEETFESNGWRNEWFDCIYDYHHYHSTAHEVLGVARGIACLHFGGQNGVIVNVQHGDVIIIPAGVSHKCLTSSHDFKCVGAYPLDQHYDMNYGKPEERPQADKNIIKVPLPKADPVFGESGPLMEYWKM